MGAIELFCNGCYSSGACDHAVCKHPTLYQFFLVRTCCSWAALRQHLLHRAVGCLDYLVEITEVKWTPTRSCRGRGQSPLPRRSSFRARGWLSTSCLVNILLGIPPSRRRGLWVDLLSILQRHPRLESAQIVIWTVFKFCTAFASEVGRGTPSFMMVKCSNGRVAPMDNASVYVFVTSTILLACAATAAGQLSMNYYASTCPQAEAIVTTTIQSASVVDPVIPAKILRLFFHDCFVQVFEFLHSLTSSMMSFSICTYSWEQGNSVVVLNGKLQVSCDRRFVMP